MNKKNDNDENDRLTKYKIQVRHILYNFIFYFIIIVIVGNIPYSYEKHNCILHTATESSN